MRRTYLVSFGLLLAVASVSVLFLFCWNKSDEKNGQNASPLIRQTANGIVEGNELTTSLGQKYYAFYGIPYAAPPITGIDPYTGEKVDRRFKPTEPLKVNWTGTLKNDELNILCLTTQILPASYHHKNYSEDCLFLNIFVPAGGAEKKTTLVYIHGAGMDGGVTTDVLLGPDFFLSQDNVVVHLEYRVQMFGFLNLGFGEYTGNMGLKDQQLGLKWIYENIEQFSGKKDEIMIFGGSSGASFVHAHMLNLESRKYFSRSFMSSGCVSAFHLRTDNHLPILHECLQTNKTSNELVEFLKTANSLELSNCNYLPWIIFMENPNAPQPFISQTPTEIYKSDKAPVMDAMFSISSQESVQFSPEVLEWTEPAITESGIVSNRSLPYDEYADFINPEELRKTMEKLRKVYFPDTSNVEAIKRGNLNYHSDFIVRDSVLKTVAFQADVNNNSTDKSQHRNTFLIRLSTHSDLNTMKTKKKRNYTEAAHSDDLCYMFYCHFLDDYQNVTAVHIQNKDEIFDIVIRRVKMITNFARFGNPTIEGDTQFKSCKSSDEIYCHEISNDPKIRITTDIKNQLHYDTWREVEDVYQKWQHM